MRNPLTRLGLLAALLVAVFAGLSYADDYYGIHQPWLNISGPNQLDGVNVNPNTGAPGNFTTLTASGTLSPNGGTAPQGTVFSTVESGNPLVLQTVQALPVASVNAAGGYPFIAGVSGRKIYPGQLVVTAAGGTASGSTRVLVECTSGNVIASIAVGALVNSTPVTPFSTNVSSGTGFEGCAVSDGVFISNVGSNLATTTSLFVNFIYTVQ